MCIRDSCFPSYIYVSNMLNSRNLALISQALNFWNDTYARGWSYVTASVRTLPFKYVFLILLYSLAAPRTFLQTAGWKTLL